VARRSRLVGDRLVGGWGTLANDNPAKPPTKTVESYWPYAATLFDYIKRAMPLTAPGSRSDDDVYTVAAYVLAQANIDKDAKSLATVQMPNRDGFIPDHCPGNFAAVARTSHQDLAMTPARK
jgi:hypothetical protein